MSHVEQWTQVAQVSDMREGEGFETGIEVDGEPVNLFMIDGAYYAVGDCTHERGPMGQGQLRGMEVMCPWHSARFDVTTGQCRQGPMACRVDGSIEVGELGEIEEAPALRRFEVKVDGDRIFVRPSE